jgi:hypothetical protein
MGQRAFEPTLFVKNADTQTVNLNVEAEGSVKETVKE